MRVVRDRGGPGGAVGLALGAIAAAWCTRLLAGLLFGVPASDPITYASAASLLAAAGLAAVIAPAWQASRMKPGVVP